MNNTHSMSRSSVSTPSTGRRRPVTAVVPAPVTKAEHAELRDLLQANLAALHAILEEHQRTLDASLRAVDGIRAELRAELRALGDARAPWVKALADTRALLYVALREVVVGDDEDAAATVAFAAMGRDPHAAATVAFPATSGDPHAAATFAAVDERGAPKRPRDAYSAT